jgi:TatA/E family protein of Tat protein translocase
MGETIFLFILALVIFGPKKLPEIARQVGKYLNEFKRASNEFKAQIEQEIAHLETENKPNIHTSTAPPDGVMSRTLVSVPYDGAAGFQPAEAEPQATLAATASETSSEGNVVESAGATEAVASGPVSREEEPERTGSTEAVSTEAVSTEVVSTEPISTEPMNSTSQESHA